MRVSYDIINGICLCRVAFNGHALGVGIAPSTQWATVYSDDDKPAATLQRARVYSSEPAWRAYALTGVQIGNGFRSPIGAMRAVARHVAKEQAAAMRGRVAQAALWSRYRYGATPGKAEGHGPETEAVLRRDGHHLNLEWWRFGTKFAARVYEPQGLAISDALADLLALALEQRPTLAGAPS